MFCAELDTAKVRKKNFQAAVKNPSYHKKNKLFKHPGTLLKLKMLLRQKTVAKRTTGQNKNINKLYVKKGVNV